MKPYIGIFAAITLPASALGQAIIIDADIPLTPGETGRLTMSASFDDTSEYAIAGIATRLDYVETSGRFFLSDPQLIAPMNGPGTSAGAVGATSVDGIVAGQLNFPAAGIFADPTNPIAFWEVDFTFEFPTGGGVAILDLSTVTSRFDVYVDRGMATSESRLGELTEGQGQVVIFPAPSGACALLGGLAMAARRRR